LGVRFLIVWDMLSRTQFPGHVARCSQEVSRMRVLAVLVFTLVSVTASAHTLEVRGSCIVLDGKSGAVQYRAAGDLDGDGKPETVFSTRLGGDWASTIVVARQTGSGWKYVAEEWGGCDERISVTDINGDGRLELIERGMSGDGHGICSVMVFREGRLREVGRFGQTRFRDLNGDHIPEVLSVDWISFGFVGDHWLTIYKWNGQGYADVSRRFPREYDRVIRDIRREIYLLRYTRCHGSSHQPSSDPELFADMYYYLGKAYEYRGLLDKARAQCAIAYRLQPGDEEIAADFRRMWKKKPHPATPRG